MRKIPNSIYDRINYMPTCSQQIIGFYDSKRNEFRKVAVWKCTRSNSGAEYGILHIWSSIFVAFNSDFHYYEKQGSNNVCGNYCKTDANIQSCLYQFKCDLQKYDDLQNETLHTMKSFKYKNCGNVRTHIIDLCEWLQQFCSEKLCIIDVY